MGPLCHLWVQAWTDKDYLNLRALFGIISSSGRSPEKLFLRSGNSPASVQLTVCKHFLLSHLLLDRWSAFFNLGQNVPLKCLFVQVPKRIPVRRQTWPPSPSLIFLVIASPQKLLDGFDEFITHVILDEFITHVMRTYYRCEKFVRVLHSCDKYVRFFHTCYRFV